MANEKEAAEGAEAMVSQIETASAAFENGLVSRLANVRNVSADWDAFVATLGTHVPLWSLVLIAIGCFVITQLLVRGILRLVDRRSGRAKGLRRGLTLVAAALAALALMLLLTRLAIADETIRTVARFWVLASLILILAHAGLMFTVHAHKIGDQPRDNAAVDAFVGGLSFVVGWAVCGIAVSTSLRVFNAGPGLRDLFGTTMVTVLLVLLIATYWRHRQTVRNLILVSEPQSRFRQKLAALWPWIAILVALLTILGAQAALTIGQPLPPLATFLTLLLVLIAPHLDTVAAEWAERGLESPDVPVLDVAWRRTFRFLVLVTIFSLLAYFWVTPVLEALGLDPAAIAARVGGVGVIVLLSVFMWNAVGAFAARVARREAHAEAGDSGAIDEKSEEPRSRLSTILPLIVGTSKAAIVSVGVLSVLVAVGINVLPILGGLSVFGLAIGFGSQTLVKDIVAGLFFLTDDAFRMGEYIETSGSKGTVEKISVRSVSLRNPRGAVATVPYGQIGKVTNFSRGWVIEKFIFRVAFDTDVDLVRKLFKKIGQEVAANPDLAPDLLETFKSQGIGMVEDGTLLLRGKFMARAGHQFGIKKAVLTAVQKAFTENGIKVVPKPFV